jgi:hypothetical protein
MGGMIRFTADQWAPLSQRLRQDYHDQPSVMTIRAVMRRVLGCTVRHHREWVADVPGSPWRHPREWIYLDFYDAALETWFRLKYAEFLP